MKKSIIFACALCAVLFSLWSCSPEQVNPGQAPNSQDAAAFITDPLHIPPSPQCSYVDSISLISPQFGSAYPLGQILVLNSNTELYFGIEPSAGLFISNVRVWYGDGDANATPPLDQNGDPDPASFPIGFDLNPLGSVYSVRIPIDQIYDHTLVSLTAELVIADPNGNITNSWQVFAGGTPVGGGYVFSFFPEANCPVLTCEPWQNAQNPCVTCGSVTVQNPGYNPGSNGNGCGNYGWGNNYCNRNISTTFDDCDGEVTVSSSSKLKKVTLLFDDCSKQTFYTSKKKSGTFSGTGSNANKTILGVWVKNGCSNSCGRGEFISRDGSTLSDLGCSCYGGGGNGGGGGNCGGGKWG